MPQTTFGERVLQGGDEMWTVREVSAHTVPGARAERCLICESSSIVRRLWDYPEGWQHMSDDELLGICNRAV